MIGTILAIIGLIIGILVVALMGFGVAHQGPVIRM